jgi:clan AA aspartic protease
MGQEKGFVTENLESVLSVRLTNGAAIDCVLDTGFNGSLLLPRCFVEENKMELVGREPITMVEKHKTEIDAVAGEINWLGKKFFARILVSENEECLIGTQLLVDSKLEIDYKDLTVKITK